MKLHQHIMHHVNKHKENVIAHVKKHHKKYIFGAWIVSWVTIAKVLGITLIFLWLSQSTHTGADYYDLQYEQSLLSGKVYIDTIKKALEAQGIYSTGSINTGSINTGSKSLPTNNK